MSQSEKDQSPRPTFANERAWDKTLGGQTVNERAWDKTLGGKTVNQRAWQRILGK